MALAKSNNLISCLECNWCHIKYVGQTKNRIIDSFQGHIFDIKHANNTTLTRNFHSYKDQLDPRMTIHILDHIKLPKDIPGSNSLRDKRELVWKYRLNTLIPNDLNILGLRQLIQELKGINKGNPKFFYQNYPVIRLFLPQCRHLSTPNWRSFTPLALPIL